MALAMLGGPAAAAPAPRSRLLILGDSLTAGYGLPAGVTFQAQLARALAQAGRHVTLIDGAVSGDTSAGGRARLGWMLGGGKVDAALVELCANDGLRGLPTAEMGRNLAAVLDVFAARHIPVLFSGMYAPPNFGAAYEARYRAVFDRLGARPGLLYDPFFLAGVARVPALTQADGLHPNARGVAIIVARLLPLIEKLLAEVPAGGAR